MLVPVAARWTEPSRRIGPLRAYAEEAEARTLERLEAALQNASWRRQAEVASWRTRLAQFDRDLETEPDRIREFYEVRARRVEPIGLAYLWPDTG